MRDVRALGDLCKIGVCDGVKVEAAAPQQTQQGILVRILPWFVKAAGESLGPDFDALDKDPHSGVDIQNSSIGSEGSPLRFPEEWDIREN